MPRRVLAVGVAVLLAVTAAGARAQQDRPLQVDPVVRLLADLEAAILSGHLDEVRALAGRDVPAESLQILERTVTGGPPTSLAIRERSRAPKGAGSEIVADALIARGRNGRLATWVIQTEPSASRPGRFDILALVEPASLAGLVRLSLDATKQFAVRDFRFTAPDFVVTMRSGSAFVAEDDGGVTAIVLNGRGAVAFTPPDAAEQGQLRVLTGRPAFETGFDSAFLRLNSAEFASRIAAQALTPVGVKADDLARARAVFDDRARRAYSLDLRDLSSDRWSIAPSTGSALVDFRAGRWGWLSYVRAPNDAEDVVLFDRAQSRNLSSYASAERLATRGRFYSEDDGRAYDVDRYEVEATFTPDRQFVSGRTRLHLRVTAGTVNSLTLRLAESVAIGAVTSPQFDRLLAVRVSGQNNIIVNLPTFLARGSALDLDVTYSGRVDPEAVDRDTVAPTLAETDAPSTLTIDPEPRLLYSSQVYWYPQSTVTDYATAVMRLRVPSEYQIVASGTVTGSGVGRGADGSRAAGPGAPLMRTVEFAATRPVRYLSCVISRFEPVGQTRVAVPAVARPVRAGGTHAAAPDATVSVAVVSTPRIVGRNRQLPARVADIIRVFAERMGEAPYPDLTVAAVEDNLPGGHSPAYFSIWLQPLASTPYTWINDPLALEGLYPPIFLAHEIAHQWWGQAIGWKNYHEHWLSEGLAQYFAALYAEADEGPGTMRALMRFMRDSAADHTAQGPIALGYRVGHVRRDPKAFRAVIYNKAAVVLHMLRRLIGDEAFFSGLRRFYQTHRFAKAGTDDLQRAFEAETPMKLDNFFERWIRGATLPSLRVTSSIDDAAGRATVRVEQIGDVFDVPLTVNVQYIDGTSEQVTVPVTAARVEHTIPLKSRARRIDTRDELILATYVR